MLRHFVFTLLAIGLLSTPVHAPGCGPMFVTAIFSHRSYPAIGPEQFQNQRMGVIHPEYWRMFLVVAWRNFQNQPVRFVKAPAPDPEVNPVDSWVKARATVPGLQPPARIFAFRNVEGQYWQYQNCGDDAFMTAAATLAARAKQFGPASPAVKAWVEAQDVVFSNCDKGAQIPPPASADLPETIRADREYQIAAAYFYSGQFDEAARRFRAIGEDAASPWKELGPYLAARCLIRAGTLGDDKSKLVEAGAALAAIPGERARKLREFVAIRTNPDERLAELTKALMDPAQDGEFEHNLTDYLYLMDKANLEQARKAGEMSDWIATFQSRAPETAEYSIERFRQTGRQTWLVAALSKMDAQHERAGQLMEAAGKVSDTHASYESAAYYRLRLMRQRSSGPAVQRAAELLLARADLTTGTRNLILHERQAMAESLDEFLRFAPRTAAGGSYFSEADSFSADSSAIPRGAPSKLLDSDTTTVLNYGLPLSTLVDAALSPRLPAQLARRLAVIAYTRAAVLDDTLAAGRIAPILTKAFPSLGAVPRERFGAALMLLRNPGFLIEVDPGYERRYEISGLDTYRANWWCPVSGQEKPAPPRWLTADQLQALEKEWPVLAARRAAPVFLGAIAIDHAKGHPEDPKAAEALHLTMRATRYGCPDRNTGEISKAAFELLHKQWPRSEWAKKTPFWFK